MSTVLKEKASLIARLQFWPVSILAVLLAVRLLGGETPGRGDVPEIDAGSTRMLRSPDVKFSTVAAQESTAEVELGRVASEKSRSPEVKTYGELMIHDHHKASAELQRLSVGRLMTLPEALDARGLLVRTKLAGLEGPKFDRAYIKAMVKADTLTIKSYKKEVKIGTDPGLKSFASDTLPVLMSHLEKAKALRALVSAKSAR